MRKNVLDLNCDFEDNISYSIIYHYNNSLELIQEINVKGSIVDICKNDSGDLVMVVNIFDHIEVTETTNVHYISYS